MKRFYSMLVFISVFLMFVLVSPVNAQAEKGDSELLLFGNMYADLGAYSFFSINATANYGVFISNSIQVGGGPTLAYTTKITVSANVFARKYFMSEGSKKAFYAGVETYMNYIFDEGDFLDKLFIRPLVGMKYYFAEKAAFDINVGYGIGLGGGGGLILGTFGVSIIL